MPNFTDPVVTQVLTSIGTIFAVITSIVSIAVSIIALRMQRNHDRKSVLPIPQIDFGDYEDCLYVKIENAGVGPAIITDFKAINTETGETAGSIIELMPNVIDHFYWGGFVQHIKGRAIPAQSELTIISFLGDSDEIDSHYVPGARALIRDAIRRELTKLTMSLVVSDVYGKKIECSRGLEWFGRRIGDGPVGPAKRVFGYSSTPIDERNVDFGSAPENL